MVQRTKRSPSRSPRARHGVGPRAGPGCGIPCRVVYWAGPPVIGRASRPFIHSEFTLPRHNHRSDSRGPAGESARNPVVSMLLMAVFVVGGAIGLVTDWPAGPANLDWGVWVVVYGGYGFVISAALFHALTGR